jgi:hypothetical protein
VYVVVDVVELVVLALEGRMPRIMEPQPSLAIVPESLIE